jgi:hypothetical protein
MFGGGQGAYSSEQGRKVVSTEDLEVRLVKVSAGKGKLGI